MPKGSESQIFTLTTALECLELMRGGASMPSLRERYKCGSRALADLKFNRSWHCITRDALPPSRKKKECCADS